MWLMRWLLIGHMVSMVSITGSVHHHGHRQWHIMVTGMVIIGTQ